jgi:two-component system, cell cycle sensor histidine kinase and response regulator CckA
VAFPDGRSYISGIGWDVTERRLQEKRVKELQEQLIQAQRLEALGTLAGGVAHNFNNLLMAIQGYASLLLLNMDPAHPHWKYLEGIEAAVTSAADLTRQLLGFARGGKYQIQPTDINDLVKKTSEMFIRTQKTITLHSKYQVNLWTVEGDRGLLEQVLMNLYVNAWQAMTAGGSLYLETENHLLDEQQARAHAALPGRYVRISVKDTGQGMDENIRQQITPDVRVLLSSGYSIDELAQDLIDRGYSGFIQKPFSIDQLSQRIREVLGTGKVGA